ncbi:MAG: hypothetical protein ACKOQY_04595 [Bacteroidota bacterium]
MNGIKKLYTPLIVFMLLFLTSCDKEPGDGGSSEIRGTVVERDYILFPGIYTDGPAQELDVYICYGTDDNAIDDRTRTSFDGSFKFSGLRKGDYRVFIYTEDTALTNYGNQVPVQIDTRIDKNHSEQNLGVLLTHAL